MPRIHTHYDNLRVTRNAPPEVIRAAYKSLSQKFHPDRNQQDPSATRNFQIINTAYEVLSDPLKRREHDDWIASNEGFSTADGVHQPSKRPQDHAHRHDTHGRRSASGNDHAAQRNRTSGWKGPIRSLRRLRSQSSLRHASGYLFLSAVASLVFLAIMLG